MAKRTKKQPTELELEILKVLWERGPSTVAEVRKAFSRRRPMAYTTVLTMLKVMTQKGLVVRNTSERAYVYRPAESRSTVVKRMVGDLLHRVLDDSAPDLVLHALEDRHFGPEELAEIRRTIEEIERRQE
jgi:BlaI family transcriptional regulator, penicillinase repressor